MGVFAFFRKGEVAVEINETVERFGHRARIVIPFVCSIDDITS